MFNKRFSLGLTLDSTVDQFVSFLKDYNQYIHDFYCSLPLGDRFHSRSIIAKQFRKKENQDKFLLFLDLIKKANIKIEVVFNTNNLNEEDFISARDYISDNHLKIDTICIKNKYISYTKKYFPEVPRILSFNDEFNSVDDIEKYNNDYEYYVVGRSGIRNEKLFEKIRNHGSKTILLLNNGCSFQCKTCKPRICNKIFEQNLKTSDINYLYAVQSIFPFEILERKINVSSVDYFKISSRSNNIFILRMILDSYLKSNEIDLIKSDYRYYYLYCRMSWFSDYYNKLDLDKILEIKNNLYK